MVIEDSSMPLIFYLLCSYRPEIRIDILSCKFGRANISSYN